jgi:hypothetical protein
MNQEKLNSIINDRNREKAQYSCSHIGYSAYLVDELLSYISELQKQLDEPYRKKQAFIEWLETQTTVGHAKDEFDCGYAYAVQAILSKAKEMLSTERRQEMNRIHYTNYNGSMVGFDLYELIPAEEAGIVGDGIKWATGDTIGYIEEEETAKRIVELWNRDLETQK